MIPLAILKLLGIGAPEWLKGRLKWLADVLIVAALLGGIYAWIEHRGEKKGAAKVEAKVEKAHAKTVAEAKADSAQAQATVDAIGQRVAKADDQTTALVRSKITEIHNDLDSTPGTPAGGPVPTAAFDTGGVRSHLNDLVDGANGAADAADAER